MFIVFRAKRLISILCLTIFAISGIILSCNRTLVPVFLPNKNCDTICYIIDAGHGGEDGGAVAKDGTIESDLNLSIAKKINSTLFFLGLNSEMTRKSENAVYSDDAVTLREKKRSDLKNRVDMINAHENKVLISIHQNSLPSAPNVHGAQVFYNHNDTAALLAEQIQLALNSSMNAAKPKTAKQIDSSIYLMRQVNCPAVLVECGFLSNASETQQLKENTYQTKLAVAVISGILNDMNGAITNESK